jgi:hypothetical protein
MKHEIDRENRDWEQVDREIRDWEKTIEYEIDHENRDWEQATQEYWREVRTEGLIFREISTQTRR